MHEYPTSRDNILSNFRLIMAAAILRFGMVFYGVVLVMLVLCNSDTVTGKGVSSTTTIKPTTNATASPTTPTTKNKTSSTSTVAPSTKPDSTTTSTAKTMSTMKPTASSSTAGPTSNGTKSTPTSNTSSTATPTAHGNHSTTVSSTNMSSTKKMNPTPTPEGHGTDRGKWVATGFSVFFLITTIVMTVLYFRQRKIYRELEGDSSLSRLI